MRNLNLKLITILDVQKKVPKRLYYFCDTSDGFEIDYEIFFAG